MTIAFLIGLFSAFHCFGMCGGIAGVLTMSLEPRIRQQTAQLFIYNLAYNTGRILSYMIAGLIVGWLGRNVVELVAPVQGLQLLRALAALLVIVLGMYLGGWFPKFALIERLGAPLWQRLQPVGQRLLPVRNLSQAFLFGAIWGWLPCGLVYYALLLALSAGSAVSAALFMLAFGAGTLLPLLLAGILAGRLTFWRQSRKIQWISGGVLVFMGLIGLWLVFDPGAEYALHFHAL